MFQIICNSVFVIYIMYSCAIGRGANVGFRLGELQILQKSIVFLIVYISVISYLYM